MSFTLSSPLLAGKHFVPVSQPVVFTGNSYLDNLLQFVQKAKINVYQAYGTVPEVSYIQDREKYPAGSGAYEINFDIHDVLGDMVTFPYPLVGEKSFDGTLNLYNFKVSMEGYYLDTSAQWHGLGEQYTSVPGPYYFGTNTVPPPGEGISFINQFVIPDTTADAPAKFLTNAPDKKPVSMVDSEYLAGYSNRYFSNVHVMVQKGALGMDRLEKIGLSINPLQAMDTRHFFIGSGPDNLNKYQPNYIDNAIAGYSVWLAELGTNSFPDADSGTMEANITGLTGPNLSVPVHCSAYSHSGNYAAEIDCDTTAWTSYKTVDLMKHSNAVTMLAHTEYYISAYIYLERGAGYSQDEGVKFSWSFDPFFTNVTSFFSYNVSTYQGDIYEQWQPIAFKVVTGATDVTGHFKLRAFVESARPLTGLTMYVDDIKLRTSMPLTEQRTFVLNNHCQQGTRVHFLNRLGGYDSYTFTATEVRKLTTENLLFERYRGHKAGVRDRGKAVQSINATETLIATTDALTTAEALWLEELLTSPNVFVQRNGENIPVIVSDGEFVTNDDDNSLLTLTVELQIANAVVTQRG